MQTIVTIHSIWRWVALLVALATVIIGVQGLVSRNRWSSLAAMLSRVFPVAIDIQVLLGIILWIGEQRWSDGFFFKILHPLLGLAALAVAHIVAARIRRATTDEQRYQLMGIGYVVVLLIILVTIPTYARLKLA